MRLMAVVLLVASCGAGDDAPMELERGDLCAELAAAKRARRVECGVATGEGAEWTFYEECCTPAECDEPLGGDEEVITACTTAIAANDCADPIATPPACD